MLYWPFKIWSNVKDVNNFQKQNEEKTSVFSEDEGKNRIFLIRF